MSEKQTRSLRITIHDAGWPAGDLAFFAKDAARQIARGVDEGVLHDLTGHPVGEFVVSDDGDREENPDA